RHFYDNVVDGRLEIRGSGSGDRIGQLIEVVADGELRGDLGNGVSRSFGCQRRGTRYTRVDLDTDDLVVVIRVERELDVAASGKLADPVHHFDGQVAHMLVDRIGKGHRRRYGDRVARVDTHRVEVFDRADDDHVAEAVAEQFQLVFFPAH